MTIALGRRTLGAAAASLLAAPHVARAQGQTLTIAIGGSITSLDPHFFNAAPNNMLKLHLFDCLTWRDERARVQPWLATEWRLINDNLWEFKLRPNVTWHDGRPFTADDVVFTFQRSPNVPNSPGGFGSFTRTVTQVEVVDPLTLRLHTSRPTPTLLPDLASVAIISRHVGEGATTDDYNAGRAAIGTGAYRLVSHRPGDRTELVRNENWWGPAPAWQRVSYRFISNDSARTAALLAGDVDVIDQISLTDVPRMRREARVTVSEIPAVRLVYIQPDFSRTGPVPGVTDNAGQPLPTNPFLDVRVRRALNMAINRQALVQAGMDGLATAAGQWLPEGVWSYDPQTRVPAFDAEGARRLLAEAGFPQGFRLVLTTPNDRWPNDARSAQAVAQMWTRVGVATQVEALPWSSYSTRGARQEFGMSINSWGSTTGEGLSFPVNILQTFNPQARTGVSNARRHSNAEFDAMIDRAASTMDDAERERLIAGLVRWSTENVPMFPLLHLTNFWGVRRGLTHAPRMDERTLAMGVRPVTS
jgi:peptide/nickel transport system substrate-binding protein